MFCKPFLSLDFMSSKVSYWNMHVTTLYLFYLLVSIIFSCTHLRLAHVCTLISYAWPKKIVGAITVTKTTCPLLSYDPKFKEEIIIEQHSFLKILDFRTAYKYRCQPLEI